MAFVNAVADGLADEVVGNGIAGEAVLGEEGPFLFDVIRFGEGADPTSKWSPQQASSTPS